MIPNSRKFLNSSQKIKLFYKNILKIFVAVLVLFISCI